MLTPSVAETRVERAAAVLLLPYVRLDVLATDRRVLVPETDRRGLPPFATAAWRVLTPDTEVRVERISRALVTPELRWLKARLGCAVA